MHRVSPPLSSSLWPMGLRTFAMLTFLFPLRLDPTSLFMRTSGRQNFRLGSVPVVVIDEEAHSVRSCLRTQPLSPLRPSVPRLPPERVFILVSPHYKRTFFLFFLVFQPAPRIS